MIGASEHAKPEGRALERVIITGASAGVGRAIGGPAKQLPPGVASTSGSTWPW